MARKPRVILIGHSEVCLACRRRTLVADLVPDRRYRPDGYKRTCRSCDRIRVRAYYWKNRRAVLMKAHTAKRAQITDLTCKWEGCNLERKSLRHSYCAAHSLEAFDRRNAPKRISECSPLEAAELRAKWRRESRKRQRQERRLYDAAFQATRKRLKPLVATGQFVCPRCHEQIAPGQRWDLGHKPKGEDGPELRAEHMACNRATRAHRNGRPNGAVSRNWLPA